MGILINFKDRLIMLMRHSTVSLHFLWNSSGVFLSAEEDKTGILDVIEGKIARATMLPRNHGEVLVTVFHHQYLYLSWLADKDIVYNYDYMISKRLTVFNLMDLKCLFYIEKMAMFICKYKVKDVEKLLLQWGRGVGWLTGLSLSCSGGWKPVGNTCIIAFCISFQSACFFGYPFFLFSFIFFGMGKKISWYSPAFSGNLVADLCCSCFAHTWISHCTLKFFYLNLPNKLILSKNADLDLLPQLYFSSPFSLSLLHPSL